MLNALIRFIGGVPAADYQEAMSDISNIAKLHDAAVQARNFAVGENKHLRELLKSETKRADDTETGLMSSRAAHMATDRNLTAAVMEARDKHTKVTDEYHRYRMEQNQRPILTRAYVKRDGKKVALWLEFSYAGQIKRFNVREIMFNNYNQSTLESIGNQFSAMLDIYEPSPDAA